MNLLLRHSAPRNGVAILALCLAGPFLGSSAILSGSAMAQVVQLPAVHTFGTTGTVSVPDQGGALLGGNGYSRSGSINRGWGPVGSRASGHQGGASTMSVHATIIDLDAMDQAILNSANARTAAAMSRSSASAPSSATAAATAAATTSPQTQQSNPSIQTNFRPSTYGTAIANTLNPTRYSQHSSPRTPRAANDWQLALAGASRIVADDPTPGVAHDENGEVRHYMQRAADAQNSGRIAAANVYYRLAYEHMSPQQQQRFNALVEQRKAAALNAVKKQTPKDKEAVATSASVPASSAAGAEPAAGQADAASAASPFEMPAASGDANASPF